MLNQIVLVGRLTSITKSLIGDELTADATISIARANPDKDSSLDNVFDTAVVRLHKNIAKVALEDINLGDLIGVKGHIESDVLLIADKITYLSSSTKKGGE